jgi:hypothetical protein
VPLSATTHSRQISGIAIERTVTIPYKKLDLYRASDLPLPKDCHSELTLVIHLRISANALMVHASALTESIEYEISDRFPVEDTPLKR